MARLFFSLLIIGLFFYVASPLLIPVAMGAIFAVLFFPWLEALERRKVPSSLASAALTIGITLVILLPGVVLVFLGARAGVEQLRAVKSATPSAEAGGVWENILSATWAQDAAESLSRWLPVEVDEVLVAAEEILRGTALKAADLLGEFFARLPSMTMGMVIMIISIFFLLVDGGRIVAFVRKNSVFKQDETERLIHSFAGMCRSVILATVASGFAQSLLFGLACLALRVPSASLIGLLVFLASFIPLIGSSPITFGVALYQLLSGNKTIGLVLLVVAVIVGLIDNFIRPLVLKGSGNLHPLLAFIAAFGGLQVLGFVGVFLGPILAGLCVVTIQNMTRSD